MIKNLSTGDTCPLCEKLKEALRFYANSAMYDTYSISIDEHFDRSNDRCLVSSVLLDDSGEIASKALGEIT